MAADEQYTIKLPTLADFGQHRALYTEEEGPHPQHLAPIRGLPGRSLVGALTPRFQVKSLLLSQCPQPK